jgi:hypothetical protein
VSAARGNELRKLGPPPREFYVRDAYRQLAEEDEQRRGLQTTWSEWAQVPLELVGSSELLKLNRENRFSALVAR